jgi:hypothetical protein
MSISVNATSSSSHWHAASVEMCPFRAVSISVVSVVLFTLEGSHRFAKFVNLPIVFASGNLIRYWNQPKSVMTHIKASCRSVSKCVTDLQGPPSGRAQSDKIRDLKSLAKQYARDQGSCDDTRISYLEYVESEAEADWTLARMIAG